MSEFYVGQKVVCVDAEQRGQYNSHRVVDLDLDGLTLGAVYTVKDLLIEADTPSVVLAEITRKRPARVINYAGFAVGRFRPLESKAISIFRKIARDVTEGRTVEIADA